MPENELEDDPDTLVECQGAKCQNALVVQVIRADSQLFMGGFYRFAAVLPGDDGLEFSIECYLAFTESGFECSTGDLGVLGVRLDEEGQVIWMTLLAAPQSATMIVEYNNQEIGRRIMTPAYEEMYLNGAACPPACLQAKEAMAVESW